MIFQALPIVEQSGCSIDYRALQYREHSKIFDEKLISPLSFFLNGTMHFCLHRSMHFLILRKKVSRYLDNQFERYFNFNIAKLIVRRRRKGSVILPRPLCFPCLLYDKLSSNVYRIRLSRYTYRRV